MNQSETIERIVGIIKKVPAKQLRIIELANSVRFKNGMPDPYVLCSLQPEINLAVTEAKVYGSHTIMAIDALVRLRSTEEES